jgi:DNA processing protein
MTPVRLAKLLDGFLPALAWKAVQAGAHPADPRRRFATPSRTTDLGDVEARYIRAGVGILLPDMAGYPSMLVGDPGAPAVLFVQGDPTVLEVRPRVAIVGTRSATHYGRQVASELARDLAAEDVVVVSGLARGIDGAAHAGALRATCRDSAPPVAVVGTGLDVMYPPSNRDLWAQVAARGAVLSESALGTKPHPGVFPARNRIIAALSDVVVVVESHRSGGSLYTAEAAARRSIPVCAVPGSVRSRASDGTNALLVDGCTPVRDVTDVLVAVSLARAGVEQSHPDARLVRRSCESSESSESSIDGANRLRTDPADTNPAEDDPVQRAVLAAVDDVPTRFETILIRTGLSIASAAEACDQLTEQGSLMAGAGWWSQRQDGRNIGRN